MFDVTRQALGLQVARFTFRKVPKRVIVFTSALSTAKRALLIMPFDDQEGIPTGLVLSMLRRMYGDNNLTVVMNSHLLKVERSLPQSKFIFLTPADLNALFLPRRHILQQIQQNSYDVAVDLNLDLVLASAYICKASAAHVRVGFVSKQADIFYNLQIKPDPTLSKKLIYDRLATCLQMF
jgi:ADP-heptose:LPS heptosyltransferase